MTDAPESWNDALDKEDVNVFVSDLVTRQIEASERAAYLRGLEDAAKVAEELAGCVVTPSPKPVYTNGFVTGISDAVDAIRELAKEGGE